MLARFWQDAYLASLQGSRTYGSIAGSFDSTIISARAANDADEALRELKTKLNNFEFSK